MEVEGSLLCLWEPAFGPYCILINVAFIIKVVH